MTPFGDLTRFVGKSADPARDSMPGEENPKQRVPGNEKTSLRSANSSALCPVIRTKTRRRQMTMTKQNKFSIEQIVTLEIDTQGNVSLRLTDLDSDNLENTLLNALYPGIKVAVVNVPQDSLDAYEESVVTNAMAKLKYRGTEYKLIGASGSAKEG